MALATKTEESNLQNSEEFLVLLVISQASLVEVDLEQV
jgi:hypothetical protein